MIFRCDPDDPGRLPHQMAQSADLGVTLAVVNVPTPHIPEHVDMIDSIADDTARGDRNRLPYGSATKICVPPRLRRRVTRTVRKPAERRKPTTSGSSGTK